MRAYTIDHLLAELGQQLPLGNGETHRRSVERHVKFVFNRIGYGKTADVYIDPFEIQAGEIDPLPDYVLDVLDAGLTAEQMRGERFDLGACSDNELAFQHTPFGLNFPNKESGTVYLKYQSLPRDQKTKRLMIMEEVYQACMDYAYALLLTNFPKHPRYNLQLTLKNDALGAIDQARAALNKRGSHAHNRVLRKYN